MQSAPKMTKNQKSKINSNAAKIEDAADARRQGFGSSRLRRAIDNKADAASLAFPQGKQEGEYNKFLNLIVWRFHERHSGYEKSFITNICYYSALLFMQH